MYNEGGKVPELVELFKQWILFCLEHGIEPYYEWTPREENTAADNLSKRVPLAWSLSPRAEDIVRAAFPGVFPSLPDLNQFANVFEQARREARDILLIHPVWPAAAWWNRVSESCIRSIELPPANECIIATRGESKTQTRGPKKWGMQASLLSFR